MEENTENSVKNTANSRTRGLKPFPKGVSGNPGGRPKDTLKAFIARELRDMDDDGKRQWLKTHKITGIDMWKMGEGNPENKTDLTSLGEKIQSVDPTDPIILTALKAIQEKLENE